MLSALQGSGGPGGGRRRGGLSGGPPEVPGSGRAVDAPRGAHPEFTPKPGRGRDSPRVAGRRFSRWAVPEPAGCARGELALQRREKCPRAAPPPRGLGRGRVEAGEAAAPPRPRVGCARGARPAGPSPAPRGHSCSCGAFAVPAEHPSLRGRPRRATPAGGPRGNWRRLTVRNVGTDKKGHSQAFSNIHIWDPSVWFSWLFWSSFLQIGLALRVFCAAIRRFL